MRQAIGTTWIMQLVIIFMLIFVAFLALTINYTKAFKIKNELVTIIEKYEGLNYGTSNQSGSIDLINNYLQYNGYTVKGSCDEGSYGATSLGEDAILSNAVKGQKYYYCVEEVSTKGASTPNRARYKIKIFFKFSLPILGDLVTFNIDGTTIDITNPKNTI